MSALVCSIPDFATFTIAILALFVAAILTLTRLAGLRHLSIFWTGAFALFVATHLLMRTSLPPLLGLDVPLQPKVELLSLYLTAGFAAAMFHTILAERLPTILRDISLFMSVYLLVFALAAIGSSQVRSIYLTQFLQIFRVSSVVAAVFYTVITIWAALFRASELRPLLVGVLALSILSSLDFLNSMELLSLPKDQPLFPLGIAAFLFSIIFLLIQQAILLYQSEQQQQKLLTELLDSVRLLHAQQMVEQEERLSERLVVATEVSEKLNPPLRVLDNISSSLQQRFDALRNSELRSIAQASQAVLAMWDKLSPHIGESLKELTEASRQLSDLGKRSD